MVSVKLDLLDSLEILSFDDQRSEYPVHYHETYCISIIDKGVFSENELIIPKGSVVISHPNEVHENRLVENIAVSFTTFYISPDVLNHSSPYDQTSFQSKVIDDPILLFRLNELKKLGESSRLNTTINSDFCASFNQIVLDLTNRYGRDESFVQIEPSVPFDAIKAFIRSNLKSKINLSKLAELVEMNKFQFTRWFKKRVGLTPFEYILLKRVGLGKQLIQQGVPLVDVALDAGFYDQSHFSNYFKKYVGLSPKVYSQSCNIFQDI